MQADHILGSVHLDRERQVIICVDPGRNNVTRISLRFEMQNPNMTIETRRARLVDQGMTMSLYVLTSVWRTDDLSTKQRESFACYLLRLIKSIWRT